MTLTDRGRRNLLRALFVALGVLPLFGTLAWAYALHTAGYRTSWERMLGAQLGLRVNIERVRYPRPGVVLFERLRLYDAETDALVLHCRTLEAEDFLDGRQIRASQPEVFAHHGAKIFASLERRLRRETLDVDRPTTFAAAELTWHTAGRSQTLVNVQGVLGPAESAQQLLVNFRLPDTAPEHPVSLRVARSAAALGTETSIELDTGAVMLPLGLFGPLTDAAGCFGERARFSGRAKVRNTAAGWSGVVTGDVLECDFDALVSTRFPHTLSGSGELRIHRAELTDGRLDHLHATVVGGPGQISRSLVESGARHLGLAPASSTLPDGSMLLFDHVAFDATWNDGGLLLKARTAERPGAILWKDDATYWREPPPGPIHAASLLRSLVPQQELLVPASWQTATLMQWLPLPKPRVAEQPANLPTATLPQATRLRVRGGDASDAGLQR